MAESNHSIFKNVFFVLDGDVKKKFLAKKKPSRSVFLPLEDRPETIMYEFIKKLSDSDDFWDDENNFTKSTCFDNYTNSSKGVHKNWFVDSTNKRFFKSGYSKLFNRWKKDNTELVEEFLNSIRSII